MKINAAVAAGTVLHGLVDPALAAQLAEVKPDGLLGKAFSACANTP